MGEAFARDEEAGRLCGNRQALFSQALFIATETDIDYIKTCIDMAHIITDVDLDRCK